MIEVIDEVLAGDELFYITPTTDQYGNTAYKIRLATPIETPGTPLNKVLFDNLQNDLTTNYTNRIDLSTVYKVGTLATETRTIVDDLRAGISWDIIGDTEIYNNIAKTTIKTNRIYSDYTMNRFVDGNANSFAVYRTATITITKPYSYKLKSIKAKIGVEDSRYLRIGTTSGLNSGTYQNFSCNYSGTDTTFVFSDNTTTQENFYMGGFTNTSASSSSEEIKLYELYEMTYDTDCNIITYNYSGTIKDGTIIKVRTPSNINTSIPTIFKINNYEICVNIAEANVDYELVYRDGALNVYNQVRNISIKTGTIGDGETIPKTAGFKNYRYFVSANSFSSNCTESGQYEIDGSGFGVTCSVNQATRVVTAKATARVKRDTGSSYQSETTSATANYIEIAWN